MRFSFTVLMAALLSASVSTDTTTTARPTNNPAPATEATTAPSQGSTPTAPTGSSTGSSSTVSEKSTTTTSSGETTTTIPTTTVPVNCTDYTDCASCYSSQCVWCSSKDENAEAKCYQRDDAVTTCTNFTDAQECVKDVTTCKGCLAADSISEHLNTTWTVTTTGWMTIVACAPRGDGTICENQSWIQCHDNCTEVEEEFQTAGTYWKNGGASLTAAAAAVAVATAALFAI